MKNLKQPLKKLLFLGSIFAGAYFLVAGVFQNDLFQACFGIVTLLSMGYMYLSKTETDLYEDEIEHLSRIVRIQMDHNTETMEALVEYANNLNTTPGRINKEKLMKFFDDLVQDSINEAARLVDLTSSHEDN